MHVCLAGLGKKNKEKPGPVKGRSVLHSSWAMLSNHRGLNPHRGGMGCNSTSLPSSVRAAEPVLLHGVHQQLPLGSGWGHSLPCFADFCRLPLLTGSISLLSTYTPRSFPTLTYPSPVPQPVFQPLPGFITFTCFKRRPNPKQPNMQNPSVAAPLSLLRACSH